MHVESGRRTALNRHQDACLKPSQRELIRQCTLIAVVLIVLFHQAFYSIMDDSS